MRSFDSYSSPLHPLPLQHPPQQPPLPSPDMFVGRSLNGKVVSLLNDQHHLATLPGPHLLHHQQPFQFNAPPLSAPAPNQGANQPPPPQQQHQPSTRAGTPPPLPPPQADGRTGRMASSEKKRNHVCPTCSKAFTTNGYLARHIRVHTMASSEKRNHVCATCSKTFTTSGHLVRHIHAHTGERNHKCPFPGCETRCSRQDNLQQQ